MSHWQVSDDEDDTHPNIDTPSLFRWRHQARVERMEEQKKERATLTKETIEHRQKVAELTKKLQEVDTNQSPETLKTKLEELKKQEEAYRKKEEELAKKERVRTYPYSNLCTCVHVSSCMWYMYMYMCVHVVSCY